MQWTSGLIMSAKILPLYCASICKSSLVICWSESSHLHLLRQKSNCSSLIVTQFMNVLFGVIHTRTLVENLLSVLVTDSSVLLTSPDTPARVWHLRWTQLTISMWCFAKFSFSFMRRVTASSNSIVTTIVISIGYELWQVTIIGIELWCDHLNNEPAVCSYTKLRPFGRYWTYLFQLMSVAYFQSVSDMSIIYNNTLITERSEGLFLASEHCLILYEQN